jgi:competence protein ComEC
LDLLVFSGTDEDHADADGFQTLINVTEGDIREIWYPDFPADTENWKTVLRLIEDLKGKGTVVRRPTAGDETTFDGIHLKVLSPHPDDSDSSNNASIVLKIGIEDVGILCPGDCESEARWRNIIKYFKSWLPSNMLLAAHHGSINGCIEEAVKIIGPEYTVISCGEDNQHDHPHDDAVEIYSKYTSEKLFVTHEVGSLLFESDGKSITNVVEDAGQDPDGKKTLKVIVGKASRRNHSIVKPQGTSLNAAVKLARPSGEPPKDRVGFGTL